MWVLAAFSGWLCAADRGDYGAGGLKREELLNHTPFPLVPTRAVLPLAGLCCAVAPYWASTTRLLCLRRRYSTPEAWPQDLMWWWEGQRCFDASLRCYIVTLTLLLLFVVCAGPSP